MRSWHCLPLEQFRACVSHVYAIFCFVCGFVNSGLLVAAAAAAAGGVGCTVISVRLGMNILFCEEKRRGGE